jgi:hypothetical protein
LPHLRQGKKLGVHFRIGRVCGEPETLCSLCLEFSGPVVHFGLNCDRADVHIPSAAFAAFRTA